MAGRKSGRAAKAAGLLDLGPMVAEERKPLAQFAEKAYLDYAMAVILDRALPYLADGLKPVQRRIIYAMGQLHLSPSSRFKKSVRTVGDVLSKYHPHSDVACYEAMVMLAQDFSCRYPVVDGQGNWGSIEDPKSFAAMRYTEARLRPYAELLLGELEQGTVDWVPNFDGSLKEPVLLPAQVPNILLNGASGIAVGMATDIPPHNLGEVVSACLHLLDHRKAGLADIMRHVPGPDFPTGGEIVTSAADMQAIYESGSGALRQRGSYHREGKNIIVTELPYQVSVHKVREQIHAQIEARKLPMLSDTRDESDDAQPVRLVLAPSSGKVDVEMLMAHLFATTDLESSRRVRLTVVNNDGLPQTMSLLAILREWIEHRLATVKRRLEHRISQIEQRLHALAALQAVYANLELVIKIIRGADDPQAELMRALSLDQEQAQVVLALPLRRLAKLEEYKMMAEVEALRKELKQLQTTVGSEARRRTLLKKELKAILKGYGDQRRTRFARNAVAAKAMDAVVTMTVEDVTIALSRRGWLSARRGHKHEPRDHEFRQGDGLLQAVRCRSSDSLLLLDMRGHCYSLPAAKVPSGRGAGNPVSSLLNPPDGTEFRGCMVGGDDQLCLLAASDGYGFLVRMADLFTRQRAGRAVLKCAGDKVTALTPTPLPAKPKDCMIAALADDGRLLLFPAADLPQRRKGRGVKLMSVNAGESLLAASALVAGESLKLWSGDTGAVLTEARLETHCGARARRGRMLPPRLRKCKVIGASDRSPHVF